jgi:hypothetical protein
MRIKLILLALFVITTALSNNLGAQDLAAVNDRRGINRISGTEYVNISINGIKRAKIEQTYGKTKQITKLFNCSFDVTHETTPDNAIIFDCKKKGIYFRFIDLSDVGDNNELEYFQVYSNQSAVSINGVTFKVGDNISILGDVKINENDSEIIFNTATESSHIVIKFQKLTNIILSITYEVFT